MEIMEYKLAFKKGFIIFDPENEKMIMESNEGLGDSLKPLNLVIDKFILNITNWYITIDNILRRRFYKKAEFRIPQEDFHMELIPFGTEGIGKLKIIHELKRQGTVFTVRKDNLYVFKSMLEEIDKTISVQDVVLKKEGNKTYINDLLLPYQVKKALRFHINEYLEKRFKGYSFTWENGRVIFTHRKMSFFLGFEGKYYPSAELNINGEDITKLLLVL